MASNIIPFPQRSANNPPPFNPNNPAHVRAWQAMGDFGQQEAGRR